MTHGQKVLRAVAALVTAVRTSAGYATEAGADVQIQSPAFFTPPELGDQVTLVYSPEKQRTPSIGNREYPVAMTVGIDALVKRVVGTETDQLELLDLDLVKALQPENMRLLYEGARLGSIVIVETVTITDLVESGWIGLRVTLRANYRERYGDPSTVPV